ncbi:MAG TPA: BolA family protein [Rhodanobacteraceae bacterium]|nr:BolA family protein [Rhodanobacteraceae bacterium]
MTRIEQIEQRLRAALAPAELSIVDEGHKHVGHAGAKDGRGHFHVHIVSDAFIGKRPLERHRMVYAALGELMQTDIHALGVDAQTKEHS